MAIFGLFGSNKPSLKAIQKQKKRAKERYAQTEYRQAAMEKLLDWNTPESLDAVLERFNAVAQSPFYDEEEKNWLSEEITERGELAKEALKNFIGKSNEVSHALSALKTMSENDAEFIDCVLNALAKRTPEDHRSLQAKKELLKAVSGLIAEEQIETIIPYLNDHNDDVQCTVIDIIDSHKVASHYAKIKDAMYDTFRSGRVLRHAALAVVKLDLSLDPKKELLPEIAEDFVLRGDKLKQQRRGT